MIGRFLIAVLVSLLLLSLGAAAYYWFAFGSGENLFREYVVVYQQHARVRSVEIDGRTVEQRFYEVEALPPIRRWEVVLPALLINNVLVLVLLSALALWYSHRITGPIYRMSKELSSALGGQRGVTIHLRKNDEFRDLALLLNRLISVADECRSSSSDFGIDAASGDEL